MKTSAALLAAALSTQAAAQVPCLTAAEFQAVARFAAPDLIDGVAAGCATSLPADAYLRRSGPALVERYRTDAAGSWPQVRTLIARVPEARMFASLDENAARGLMTVLFQEGLKTSKFKAADCLTINDAFAALDPLPAANMVALLAALVRLDKGKPAKDGKKARQPVLCPAVAAK